MIKHLKLNQKRGAFDHVEFTGDIKGLDKIFLKRKTLAICVRKPDEKVRKFISKLDIYQFPSLHTSFYSYEVKPTLQALLQKCSDDKVGLQAFIEDLAQVTQSFAHLMNTELVRFKLEVIEDDMCRFFHADYNNLRLMSTYKGPGTYWTTNENVNRERLGSRSNEEIIKDPEKVYQLNEFWIGVFKGEVFMDNAGNGIVHRSPALSLTNEKRILLRMDC